MLQLFHHVHLILPAMLYFCTGKWIYIFLSTRFLCAQAAGILYTHMCFFLLKQAFEVFSYNFLYNVPVVFYMHALLHFTTYKIYIFEWTFLGGWFFVQKRRIRALYCLAMHIFWQNEKNDIILEGDRHKTKIYSNICWKNIYAYLSVPCVCVCVDDM